MTWSGDHTVLGGATAPLLTMNSPARLDRVPASRQKSCNACVRGKRRCDKRAPNCTRCAARGLDCVYQRLPPSSSATDASSVSVSAAGVAAGDLADFDLGFDMDMEGLTSNSSPSSSSLHTDLGLQLDPVLDFSIADLVADGCDNNGNVNGIGLTGHSIDNALSPCRELWNLQQEYGGPSKLDLPPLPTVPRLPLRDLKTLHDGAGCVTMNLVLNQLYDPRTRVGWLFERATAMPTEFARTRSLSYIHPRLWGGETPAPKSLMAAFSAAAAYSASTPQNKGWTCKLIMDASREVHREAEAAETPAQRLGRVQAAVIILAIKMFDGDITMRSSAEREMPVLHEWIKDLLQLVQETCLLQDVGVEPAPKSWDTWIFNESMRRTVVWATMFSCFISLLQSSELSLQNFLGDMTGFTASKQLWEASSSTEFYRAWREKPRFHIKCFGFGDFWQYARPEDLDDFTKLLLVGQIGPDMVDQYFSDEYSAGI